MTQAVIDTLKFTEELEATGMERGQARAIARGINGALVRHLATKTDIAEPRANVAKANSSITKPSLAGVRAEIKLETSKAETRLLMRMLYSMAFLFAFIMLVLKF